MKKKRPTAKFPKSISVGQRDWGEEILLVLSEGNFTMKRLLIKKGFSGGLQYLGEPGVEKLLLDWLDPLLTVEEQGRLLGWYLGVSL